MDLYDINTANIPQLFNKTNCNAKSIFQFLNAFYGNGNSKTNENDLVELIAIWEHSLNFIFKSEIAPEVLNLVFNNLPSDFPPNLQRFKEIAAICQKIVWRSQYEKEKVRKALAAPKISDEQRLKNLQIINEKISKIFATRTF